MTRYEPLGASRPALRAIIVALTLATIPGAARAQAKALSLAEVIDLRQHGVSSRQILRNAREYCIAFALSDSVRRELSVAGADSQLVGGLTDVCTTVKPAKPPVPPIIDDEFATSTTSSGFTWSNPRCRARFETEGVRIENSGTDALCLVRYPSLDLPSQVELDLTVGQLGSSPGGSVILGFGRQERSGNYYSLTVGADHRVELCWNADRSCSPLVTLSRVGSVQTDSNAVNHLAVEIRGAEITLIVNGATVGQYTADNEVTGRVLIGVGPMTAVQFIRLRAVPLR
jgi:hypothetical protein